LVLDLLKGAKTLGHDTELLHLDKIRSFMKGFPA